MFNVTVVGGKLNGIPLADQQIDDAREIKIVSEKMDSTILVEWDPDLKETRILVGSECVYSELFPPPQA